MYADEEDSRRILVRIECDATGCDGKALPGDRLGWIQCGTYSYPGSPDNQIRLYYCPDHLPIFYSGDIEVDTGVE